jgi:hypothetical protein
MPLISSRNIEFRQTRSLAVTVAGDRSRVRQGNAAWGLGMLRRLVVSFAPVWLEGARLVEPHARARSFLRRVHHGDGGPERPQALVFFKSPTSWGWAKSKSASWK